MFRGVKRKAAAAVAVPALAMSLAGGMALQEAAPAEAVLPLLAVPIAAGIFGITGTGVTAGGAAVLAGGAAVLGLGMWASQPGSIEWLSEPDDWFKPKTDETGKRVEKLEKSPEVVVNDFSGSSTPSQDGYVWKAPKLLVTKHEYLDTTVSNYKGRVRVHFKHDQGMAANHIFYPTITATMQCFDPATKRMSQSVRTFVAGGIRQVAPTYTQADVADGSIKIESTVDIDCARAGTTSATNPLTLKAVTFRPPTTKEKYTYQSSAAQNTAYTGPVGTWDWQAADYSATDPQYRSEVECVNDAGQVTKISQNTDIGSKRLSIPSCVAMGLKPKNMTVGFADGDTLQKPLFTATPTDPMLDCDVALGKQCRMEVYIDGMPCSMGNTACMSWAGLYRVASYRVECRYGGKVVDISGCAVLEGAYISGGTPALANNIDGNPDTWTDPASSPGWVPHKSTEGVPQPDEGWKPGWVQPVPQPAPAPDIKTDPYNPEPEPSPSPEPSTSTGPTSEPSNSPNPSPSVDTPVAPKPEPPTNPEGDPGANQENCLEEAVSWNPIDWVLVPVKCALVWAFVPSTPVVDAAVELVKPKIETIGIGPLIDVWGDSIDAIPDGGGGCSGPALDLSVIHLDTYYPFSACAEPMAGIATGVNSFFGVGLVFSGCVSVIRAAGAAFGFNFSQGVGAGEK